MAVTRGIKEVPSDLPTHHRDFFQDLRENVLRLMASQAAPRPPVGLKVIPISFGNVVQFIRTDGDFYEVLWSTTPNIQNATSVNIGTSQQWQDNVGKAAITRYYWVRAVNQISGADFIKSTEVGPVPGTTLASGTAATVPAPVAAADTLVLDQKTGTIVPANIAHDKRQVP
jgi:hypothetical protein